MTNHKEELDEILKLNFQIDELIVDIGMCEGRIIALNTLEKFPAFPEGVDFNFQKTDPKSCFIEYCLQVPNKDSVRKYIEEQYKDDAENILNTKFHGICDSIYNSIYKYISHKAGYCWDDRNDSDEERFEEEIAEDANPTRPREKLLITKSDNLWKIEEVVA